MHLKSGSWTCTCCNWAAPFCPLSSISYFVSFFSGFDEDDDAKFIINSFKKLTCTHPLCIQHESCMGRRGKQNLFAKKLELVKNMSDSLKGQSSVPLACCRRGLNLGGTSEGLDNTEATYRSSCGIIKAPICPKTIY